MLKDIMTHNESVTPDGENIAFLKEKFPACFHTDGTFDLTRFAEYLYDKVNVTREGYELRFLGKDYAKLLASLETETIIQPDIEHNSKPENKNSDNIYISGDNLDALKHLLKSYAGKIKCIYIDPPYNTGSDDFVYRDSFNFSAEELQNKLDLDEKQAERLLAFTKRGSTSHSAWLMFMYPRLQLARELLSKDGVIFISIDDNEQANLKLLCDDVFGEENLVAQVIIQSNKRGQTYKQIAKTHEYLLVYTENIDVTINELTKETGAFIAEDNIGEFEERELRNRNPKFGRFNRPNLYYSIFANPTCPDKFGYMPVSLTKDDKFSIEILPLNSEGKESCWRWGTNKFSGRVNTDTMLCDIVARKKNNGTYGVYEKYRKQTYKAKSIWYLDFINDVIVDEDDDIWNETGVISEQGSSELTRLGMGDAFDFPKPVALLKKILSIGMDKESICLDFFSGSATTAQAIAELNSTGCNMHGIFVQLPENLDLKLNEASSTEKAKLQKVIDFLDVCKYPHTLNYVGIERIKRIAAKIREENPLFHGDLGFKHYTLATPPENTLDKMVEFKPEADDLIATDEMLAAVGGRDVVLTTWLVRDGYGFAPAVKAVKLHDYTAWWCKKHLYLIDPGFTEEDVAELFRQYDSTGEFSPETVVLFGYSFNEWTVNEMLDKNLRQLRDSGKQLKINLEFRY